MSIAVGEVIGSYVVEALAGRGSMADVFRARHQTTQEVVALKLIHHHLLDQPSQFERFRREAEVLKKIQHPNIARLLDFVATPSQAYMVMEYLSGGTLEQRLADMVVRRQQVSLEQAAEWMDSICGAVEYAHRHSLVHRDLKPANILFRSDGEPVLTDFGLVYWIDHPRLSGTGSLTGTPAYISPEQARGHSGDKRSDVYSLGVILYEILAGQPPFQGTTLGVAVKHISELPPSPRIYGRYLPPGVEAVVMRALAKEPVERYQSAQLLADALRLALTRSAAPSNSAAPGQSAAGGGGGRPAGPAPASRPAPITSVPDLNGPRRSSGAESVRDAYVIPPAPRDPLRQVVMPAAGLLVLVLVLGGLFWWGVGRMESSTTQASAPPRFSAGMTVRAVTDDPQASVSVLRGCPTVFWVGVVGMADAGDVGQVHERRVCGTTWWYRVSFPAAADASWDGTGWVDGKYLEIR